MHTFALLTCTLLNNSPFKYFTPLRPSILNYAFFWVYLSNVPVVVDVIDNLNILGGKIIKAVNKRVFRYS